VEQQLKYLKFTVTVHGITSEGMGGTGLLITYTLAFTL
jgi:hypothetical protein